MPGETRIKQFPQGWADLDHPNVFHATRAVARDARKASRAGTPVVTTQIFQTVQTSTPTLDLSPTFSGLQNRLLNRMVNQQGVSVDDATSVIETNGYNKAASYGHMREAGADHYEALVVIGMDDPAVSLAYGQARAAGEDHVDALMEAFRSNQDLSAVPAS